MYGNSFESFLIAVANPNQHILEKWAAENGVSGDYNALCQNAKAKEFILGELVKMGKEKKVILSLIFSSELWIHGSLYLFSFFNLL